MLGEDSFIEGSDEGIVGMKVGGARTIIIPSKLAYGEQGRRPIPPNTDIKVGVEVMDVMEFFRVMPMIFVEFLTFS